MSSFVPPLGGRFEPLAIPPAPPPSPALPQLTPRSGVWVVMVRNCIDLNDRDARSTLSQLLANARRQQGETPSGQAYAFLIPLLERYLANSPSPAARITRWSDKVLGQPS